MARSRIAAVALLAITFPLAAGEPPAHCERGDLVVAKSHRSRTWTPAYILGAEAASYRVHFEGLADRLDETLPPGDVRARARAPRFMTRPPEGTTPPAVSAPDVPALHFVRGDRVDVFWGHVWWKALVVSVEGDRYHIHYDGWPEDDEIVTASRMRPYSAKPPDGPYAAAVAALARKDYAVARERFRHALSQSEGDPDIWRGAARMHLELGEREAAAADSAKAAAVEQGESR